MPYYIGSLSTLKVTFTNLAGVPTDPTAVSVVVTAPDGTVTTYSSPIHVSTGVYTQDVPVTQVGSYNFEWYGTGTVVAVKPSTFQSYATPLAPANPIDFVTLPQLKSWIFNL